MGLKAIRTEISENISEDAAFDGWSVYDYEPKDPQRPCVVIGWPETYDPRGDFAGNIDLIIPVRFEMVWNDDVDVDDEMMTAMDEARDAIEADRTLNSTVDDLSCGAFSDIGARQAPDEKVVAQFIVPVEILV